MTATDIVTVAKDMANILFFIVMATLTVLSYLHARKTLFAPIRTETFKLQLKVFEELLSFFQDKTETDFAKAFDLQRILSLNTLQMVDSYVAKFFPDQLIRDEEALGREMDPLIGAFVSKENVERYFSKVTPEQPQVAAAASVDTRNMPPALILASWQKYEHGMIGYTQEYLDKIRELDRLAASPLLPKELRERIVAFRNVGKQNLVLIGKTVTECAKQMPEHFATADQMENFTPDWVWNHFNDQAPDFAPAAKEILDYLNKYLKVEDLMAS